MNAREKRRFIRDLTDSVTKEILAKVKDMPEAWDGIELRRYIANKFNERAIILRPRSDTHHHMRMLNFHNVCAVRNL